MTKSQFNIKISRELLQKVKRQAIMSGKSLTQHITDLITESLANDENQNSNLSSLNRYQNIEKRLLKLESIVSNREYLSAKFKPFTNSEAINCTNFIRGIFSKELEKRNINDKAEAFDDLLQTIQVFDELNKSLSERLREILLDDNPSPWTGRELNELSGGDKCNCSIRKGIITWTGITDCPSQQEICDKGEELLSNF
tara:strand:+ start:423 stop:1016 length:594 start_codon:yes stop_codon:yes gene_type:complete